MMPGDDSLTAALEAAGWSKDLMLSALGLSPSVAASSAVSAPARRRSRDTDCTQHSPNTFLGDIEVIQEALMKVDLSSFYGNDFIEDPEGDSNRNDHLHQMKSVSLCSIQEMFAQSEASAQTAPIMTTSALIGDVGTSHARSEDSDSAQLIAYAELDGTFSNGYSLFAHQKEAVISCIQNRRTILAFDMGLGKTLIGLVWAKAFCSRDTSCMLVVVAPCTLMENWRREAALVGFEASDSKPSRSDVGDSKLRMIICSWAKIGTAEELLRRYKRDRFVLVCDEAHAMQSPRSIRTQAALALCKHTRCAGCILATGTPMKNGRPANLYPLLAGIRHPVASNKTNFEKRYCDAKKTRFCAWDISGASNLEELRSVIGSHLLRKTKEECLDIAALRRVKVRALLPPDVHASYESIVQRMKSNSRGLHEIISARRAANKSSSGGPPAAHCCLEALTELRRLMSTAKTRFTAQFIRELLEGKDSPVVVFVIFRESVQLLLDALRRDPGLRCNAITGELSDHKQRQAIVDQFQLGCLDVLVCTYGVGATGLTLTRSHRVVLLDRPWTPGDVMQAEDRVRRIGQVASEVFSYWVCGFPFDDKLDSMLQRKNQRSAKVIEVIERKGIEFSKTSANEDCSTMNARKNRNKDASEKTMLNGCKENEAPDNHSGGSIEHTAQDSWNATDVPVDEDESEVATNTMIKELLRTL